MPTTPSLLYCKRAILYLFCCCTLAACQPSERPTLPDTYTIKDNLKVESDLNLLCAQLGTEMQQIDNQRSILALQEINQNLKVCLPLMNSNEQLELLDISRYMYDRFLQVQRTHTEQIAFEQYTQAATIHPTLQQQNFKQMSLRDQYLLKHQGQAYIEIVTLYDGSVSYRRSPQYLARLFAPYLPEAEQRFIEGLAQQNAQVIFTNHKLIAEPLTLAERALFWENYIRHYPKSRYQADAKRLSQIYAQLLFIGTPEHKVSERYIGSQSIDPQSLAAIEYVSQQAQSHLAQQANQFLNFIQRDSIQTQQSLQQEHQATVALLINELGLSKVNRKGDKNCLLDAICI